MARRRAGVLVLLLGCFSAAAVWRSLPPQDPQDAARERLSQLVPRPADVNVVLITIDTLRADRIGPYGFKEVSTPALDSLAADGFVFDHTTAVAPLTLPSHASMLTGLVPPRHGVHDNGTFALGTDRTTLAERFRAAGYATGGFIGAWVLEERFGMAQGFERYSDRFETGRYERRGDAVVDEAIAWIDGVKDRRFFAWLHLFDPHQPYDAPEPHRSRYAEHPYLGEIAFTDEQIGRLLAHLRASGLFERTVVAVTADHGESLGDHSEWGHGFFIYDSTTAVPLIVRTPWLLKGRSGTQVSGVDVFPTLLDVAGLAPQPDIDGGSLLRAFFDPSISLGHVAYAETFYPRYHFGWHELRALRTAESKFIDAPEPEYYDLTKDPEEQTNVYAALGPRADALRATLERRGRRETFAEPTVDPQTLARLSALGYASASVVSDPGSRAPDPKEKIGLFAALETAKGLGAEGRRDEAIEGARRVVLDDPQVVEAHLALGEWLRDAGRTRESIAAFKSALTLRPDDDATMIQLVKTCQAAGRNRDALDALRAFEIALGTKPRRPAAWYLLGTLRLDLGDTRGAEKALRRALEINPAMAPAQLELATVALRAGAWAEAERRVRDALDLDADVPSGQYTLGRVLEARGDREAAEAAYRAELGSNPEDHRARRSLESLLRKKRRGP